MRRDPDWELVRDAYLKMLLDSPDAFGETFAEAQSRSSSEWSAFVERCARGADMSAFIAEDNCGVCGFVRGDTREPLVPSNSKGR